MGLVVSKKNIWPIRFDIEQNNFNVMSLCLWESAEEKT